MQYIRTKSGREVSGWAAIARGDMLEGKGRGLCWGGCSGIGVGGF